MSIVLKKILVGNDGSKGAALATQAALGLSTKTGAELHVATIGPRAAGRPPLPHVGFPSPEVANLSPAQREADKEVQRLLNAQVEWIETAGGTVAQAHLRLGKPDAQIVALAEEIGAGMWWSGTVG